MICKSESCWIFNISINKGDYNIDTYSIANKIIYIENIMMKHLKSFYQKFIVKYRTRLCR